MKSISFSRKPSMLRVIGETKRKKNFNWDRLIYMILLVTGLFFLGRYVFYKTMYVDAQGQVLFESVSIRLIDDSRILKFHKKEGDHVKVGDSLFTYFKDIYNQGSPELGSTTQIQLSEDNSGWMEKEIFTINKTILMNKLELIEQEQLLKNYQDDLVNYRNEVILDALPKIKLESIQNEIVKIKSNIKKLKATNKELSSYISRLRPGRKKSLATFGNGSSGRDSLVKVFYSPLEGTVTRIFIQAYETALKSDNIMSIHKNKNIFIKGFFEQEDLKHLKENTKVDIDFPDGTKSEGIIKRFYFATYPLPEEFQKKYEPVTRSLAVDIFPVSEEELKKWKGFYKMAVSIRKNKYD